MRLMKGRQRKEIVEDVLQNRSKYALFITVLTTFVVLGVSSVLVLQFESQSWVAHVVSESLRCTNLGVLRAGSAANVERPLIFGGRVGRPNGWARFNEALIARRRASSPVSSH